MSAATRPITCEEIVSAIPELGPDVIRIRRYMSNLILDTGSTTTALKVAGFMEGILGKGGIGHWVAMDGNLDGVYLDQGAQARLMRKIRA